MDAQLDERKVTILKAIIKTYLETGEPVGSRTISKYSELKLSSATIRNEMSDLEEMGYIIQPHTSAGRIPSDKGYRFYVDQIMQEKENEVTEFKDVMVQKVSDDHFRIKHDVTVSGQFYGWIAGLGTDVRIVHPQSVVDGFREHIKAIADLYD